MEGTHSHNAFIYIKKKKKVNKNISRCFLDLLLQFMKYCFGSVDFHCCLTPHTEITQDTFFWSFMLHPLTRRIVVKPHMSGKCKMLCSILHEMQFVIIIPLSNSGQHTTMMHIEAVFTIHFVLYLVYNYPIIHAFYFDFNPFPCSGYLCKVACVHAMMV
jgi:hypothetical protein